MQHWGLICFGPGGDQPDAAAAYNAVDPAQSSRQQEDVSTSTSGHNISERISGPLLKTVLAMDQVRFE
jgi:hypothetical protein